MIILYERQEGDYEVVGRWDDGEWIEGEGRFGWVETNDPDVIQDAFSGPVTFAVPEESGEGDEKAEKLADAFVEVVSKRTYVGSAQEAPEGVQVQEGPRGGLYYDEEALSGSESESVDEGDQSDPEDEESAEDESEDFQPNPEEDIPRFMEDEEAEESIERVNTEPGEGFTFKRNLQVEDAFETDVYYVGITSLNMPRSEGMTKDDIVEFYEEWFDLLTDEPGLRIGGFSFPEEDKVSIDLSAAVADKDEAVELGETLNQHSIANLSRMDFPETGGDGTPVVEEPDEIREVLDGIESLQKFISKLMSKTGDTRYVGENGDETTKRKIGYSAMHGQIDELEQDGDAFIINGVRYEPVEDTAEKLGDAAANVVYSPRDGDEEDDEYRKAFKEFTTDDFEQLLEIQKRLCWSDDISKATWGYDDEVPEYVQKAIEYVLSKFDPQWKVYAGQTRDVSKEVNEILADDLQQPQGWSVGSIVDNITEATPVGKKQATNIVQTELSTIMNKTREFAYLEQEGVEPDTSQFYWKNPDDHRTTAVCKEILEAVDERGGSVPLTELRKIVKEKAKKYEGTREGGTPERADEWVPHYQCRGTFVLDARAKYKAQEFAEAFIDVLSKRASR